jgi:dihydrofolate reductase
MPGKLVAAISVSVDGVLQGPMLPDEDTSNGFTHSGWMTAYADKEFESEMAKAFENVSAMVMGRKTYDILANYWPKHADDDGAAELNRMRKYVATRGKLDASWENTKVLSGDAATTISELKARTDGTLLLQGSGDLLRTLQMAALVDEYRLFVFPIVLGAGKRVFGDQTAAAGLRLARSSTTGSGIVCSIYEYEGPPRRK